MKNTNESGRSMVEMLGVLAIIGVLSIGGIDNTGNKTPGGETISNVKIFEDAVQLKIEFTSEGVCKAAKSILGASTGTGDDSSCKDTVSCAANGGSITYCFKQS